MTGLGVCPHCDRPVIDALMRKSGQPVRLDPDPGLDGNLRLVELGAVAEFIAPEYRDPKSRWFVPAGERFHSHMVSCPANNRTITADTAAFITECDARLAGARP